MDAGEAAAGGGSVPGCSRGSSAPRQETRSFVSFSVTTRDFFSVAGFSSAFSRSARGRAGFLPFPGFSLPAQAPALLLQPLLWFEARHRIFLQLYIISLLTYIPTWGVRSGNRRWAEVFGAGPFSDTGFTARPWLSHLSAWVSSGVFWGFVLFLAGKWVCFPGDWEEARGDVGGGRKEEFVDLFSPRFLFPDKGREGGDPGKMKAAL